MRYADDFICAFQHESDARRFQSVLPKRLARFSLELAFLGFTHYCGQSRAGKFKLKRKTAKKKLRVKMRELKDWFRANLTTPVSDVWTTLNQKLCGHYQYYGIKRHH